MKNTIIYLLGFPGVGKYTIAQELARQTQALLIDNHLINNPIFSVVRADGKTKLAPQVWEYTAKIGDLVREAIVTLTPPDESFIFTNALAEEDAKGRAIYHKILDVALQRDSLFVPVRLLCDLPTLQSRIVEHDRRERMKMTDAEGIADDYRRYTVLQPGHPHTLELDTTHLTVQEAASAIMVKVASLA